MIFVLHGRKSNGADSTTCRAVREYFDDIVYCPTYNTSSSHDEISSQLIKFVSGKIINTNEEVVFIGSSMGGYWARYLANQYRNYCYIKLFMLNPSLELYDEGVEEDDPSLPITVFIGLEDDVVDPQVALRLYENRAYIKTFEKSGHRLSGELEYILPEIEKGINTYID